MPEGIALPGIPEVVFAQDTVDLHVSPWVVDCVDGEAEEVEDEAEEVEMAVCRRARVEYEVRDVLIPIANDMSVTHSIAIAVEPREDVRYEVACADGYARELHAFLMYPLRC